VSYVTYVEFSNAVTRNLYPAPSNEVYINFNSQTETKGSITSKREAAMFLAQILWESDGLRAKREYACLSTGCPGQYLDKNYPYYSGQNYYGRGYIQLV